jgi:heme-degrading monooxygenase HmoA
LSAAGFVAIYRWRVTPEAEAGFRERWHAGTLRLRALGGLGSALTRADTGEWVGIALWPSAEARQAAFANPAAFDQGKPDDWPGIEHLSEERLDMVDNLWDVSAMAPAAPSGSSPAG